MKRILVTLALAVSLAACNNAADTSAEKKDSLDSLASEKKDVIDSSAEEQKDKIDSTTERKKDAIDRKDSLTRRDTIKK